MRTALQKFTAASLVATTLSAGATQAQEALTPIILDKVFVATTLTPERFDDPKLKNVACYITRQRVNNHIMHSQELSMSCVQNGAVNTDGLSKQEIILDQTHFRLVRIFDKKNRTAVYVGHVKNQGNDKDPKTATSAVVLAPSH